MTQLSYLLVPSWREFPPRAPQTVFQCRCVGQNRTACRRRGAPLWLVALRCCLLSTSRGWTPSAVDNSSGPLRAPNGPLSHQSENRQVYASCLFAIFAWGSWIKPCGCFDRNLLTEFELWFLIMTSLNFSCL